MKPVPIINAMYPNLGKCFLFIVFAIYTNNDLITIQTERNIIFMCF